MKPLSGRVIGVFGLPCSGKSTVIKMVVESSREILAVISSGDIARRLSTESETKHMAAGNLFPHEEPLRQEILDTINKRRSGGAEAIFLDGFPRTPDQVKWMVDNQLCGTIMEGYFIQVWCDQIVLATRAKHRMRDEQDKLDALAMKIETQRGLIDKLDKTIHEYGFPYYMVCNHDISIAAQQLAKTIGLRK
jgi:adenylate kinase family enzyme